MSEMVERVANAILEAMDITDALDGTSAKHYAIAAIEAMREPTTDMLQDGRMAARFVRPSGAGGMTLEACIQRDSAREYAAWRAMIDAALSNQ